MSMWVTSRSRVRGVKTSVTVAGFTGQPGQREAGPMRYVGMFSMNAATR